MSHIDTYFMFFSPDKICSFQNNLWKVTSPLKKKDEIFFCLFEVREKMFVEHSSQPTELAFFLKNFSFTSNPIKNIFIFI